MRKINVGIDIVSSLLITLFIYAGLSKLTGINQFSNTLSQSQLIGNYAYFFTWCILVSELFVALLLIFPRSRLSGFYLATLLMIAFAFYSVYLLLSPSRPCNCIGVFRILSWKQHLIFNICFALLSAGGIALCIRKRNLNAV